MTDPLPAIPTADLYALGTWRAGRCIPLLRPHPWTKWALFDIPTRGDYIRAVTTRQRRRCLRCGRFQHAAVMQ